MRKQSKVGLYIHIPFCLAKCNYCDFNSYPDRADLYPTYQRALLKELNRVLSDDPELEVDTVYLGGGTPTVMPLDGLVTLLECIASHGHRPIEVTIEANPGTLNTELLQALRAAGVNRLSLGIQSLNEGELQLLGRVHSRATAIESVRLAREAGWSNLNVDLIFGLPGQDLESWQRNLEDVLRLEPDHLSLYALTLESGTPLERGVREGNLPEPHQDTVAEMYEWSGERLAREGFVQYEISNWAKPRYECLHNIKYWRNEDYLGVGASAWSHRGDRRWSNVANPDEYIKRTELGESLIVELECPSLHEQISETIILGLRLTAGVRWDDLRARFGVDIRELYAEPLARFQALGLLEADSIGMRLTLRGRLLGNEVFEAFLPKG